MSSPVAGAAVASLALLIAPFAVAGGPSTIPPWPLNDQLCVAPVGGSCTFVCEGGSPFILVGVGLEDAVFTMSCGKREISCATSSWAPVCGVDGTGTIMEDGAGLRLLGTGHHGRMLGMAVRDWGTTFF